MKALYVSHPQVQIDAAIPIPLWALSDDGRARARAFGMSGVIPPAAMIFSSRERKALEMAEILAEYTGTLVLSDHEMGENDRTSTGFLPPALFEATADRFFAEPEKSIDGWERAIDAQERIARTVATALASVPAGTPAIFCGHGGVGTLLKCHVSGRAICREEDQGRLGHRGGGNCFSFDLDPPRLGCDWTPMEAMSPGWFG